MPPKIRLPRFAIPAEKIPLYRTRVPENPERQLKTLAKTFAMTAKPRDAGTRLIISDRRGQLELMVASGSMRWSTLHLTTEEVAAKVDLPADADARELADAFLKNRRLESPHASFFSVTSTDVAIATKRRASPETTRIALHVNYQFTLSGLPVMGPGAKIQVTLGHRARVVECCRFWRDAEEADARPVLSVERLGEIVRGDSMIADLGDDIRVDFHEARLGYFALPPREPQGWLLPVFALRGSIATRHLERYDFVRYVVAVAFDPDEAKRLGAVSHPPTMLFG